MSEETPTINPDDVRNFYRERMADRERKDAIAATMGEKKTAFADATKLNKTAIGFAERLDRLSPEVRGDVLRSLDVIRDSMAPVWNQQEEMEFGEATADEQAENLKRKRTSARREKKGTVVSFGPKVDPDEMKRAGVNWRDDIPGVDDGPAETGDDAAFDVDGQDAALGGKS